MVIEEANRVIRQTESELGTYQFCLSEKERMDNRVNEIEDKIKTYEQAINFIQSIYDNIQIESVDKIGALISTGLSKILGYNVKFKIKFESKANNIQAAFFIQEGNDLYAIENLSGGLNDIVSLLLRVLFLVLSPQNLDRTLILDENLKFLDKDRSPEAFKFFIDLFKELGIQCIWITHDPSILNNQEVFELIPKIIRLEKNDKETIVKVVK